MANFTRTMLRFFGADMGAFSPVTKREATRDRSLTVDVNERRVIYSVYPPNSFARKGGAQATGNSDTKSFIVHDPNGTTRFADLAIVYPKQDKDELRLYFSRNGFTANKDDFWYIFTKDGESIPHIGAMAAASWNQLSTQLDIKGMTFQSQQNMDDEDDTYQKQIGAAAVDLPISSLNLKYPRKAAIALHALESAKYRCEVDAGHWTFESVTGNPYLECHHLVPVSLQSRFPGVGLDVEENIVALCANCHCLVHYGVRVGRLPVLTKLWEARKDALARREIVITFEEFLGCYGLGKS